MPAGDTATAFGQAGAGTFTLAIFNLYVLNTPTSKALAGPGQPGPLVADLSAISNTWGNTILGAYFPTGSNLWVALHTYSPGPLADPASEVSGGGYARQPTNWVAASNKTTANATQLGFDNMPNTTVTHVAVWSAVTGGFMYTYATFPTPVVVASNQRLPIAVNDLVVTL